MKKFLAFSVLISLTSLSSATTYQCDDKDTRDTVRMVRDLGNSFGITLPTDNCEVVDGLGLIISAGSGTRRRFAILKLEPLRVLFLNDNSEALACAQAQGRDWKHMGTRCPQW